MAQDHLPVSGKSGIGLTTHGAATAALSTATRTDQSWQALVRLTVRDRVTAARRLAQDLRRDGLEEDPRAPQGHAAPARLHDVAI